MTANGNTKDNENSHNFVTQVQLELNKASAGGYSIINKQEQ